MSADTVFISYSYHDEAYVRELAAGLAAHGLSPWYFTESQRAGVSWPQRLHDVIAQARAVVVVVSPHSNRAGAEYVLAEILHAQRTRRFIVPLCIEPASGPIDVLLAARNWVLRWNEADPVRKVAEAVLGQARHPEPLGDPEYARLRVSEAFSRYASRPALELEPPGGLALLELPATVTLCTIGRHPRAELAFAEELTFVGRVHARLHVRLDGAGASYLISDEGSRNGTFVNGERLGTPRDLRHGDQIGLGVARAMLRFERLSATGDGPSDSWIARLPGDE